MAASPPREVQDDTGGAQSPEAEEHNTSMENRDQQEGNQSSGFDFDIKEQDRWLPIANGKYSYFYWRVGAHIVQEAFTPIFYPSVADTAYPFPRPF